MSVVGIFHEERAPNEHGEPGPLISRQLNTFSGPSGQAVRDLVTRGNSWDMDVRERLSPLEWDS